MADPIWRGAFEVTTDTQDVALYGQAMGSQIHAGGHPIHPAYPCRWLSLGDIKAALKAIVEGTPDPTALVHLGQTVTYRSPLEPDQTYRLDVRLEHGSRADTYVLQARFEHLGAEIGTLRADLALARNGQA